MAEAMGGGEWLARTLAANGTTHVFWVDAVLRRALIELGVLGVTRVLAHTEKGAAYMADGPVVVDVVTNIDTRAPEPWLPGEGA